MGMARLFEGLSQLFESLPRRYMQLARLFNNHPQRISLILKNLRRFAVFGRIQFAPMVFSPFFPFRRGQPR
jgi:hypothetical protein